MSRSVLIVSGEASGDLYGADLAQALQAHLPDLTVYGVGGTRMQAIGVQLIADSRAWGAIGVVESLKVAPKVYLAYQRVQQFVRNHKPDWLIPIDFGAFNIPLSRWAHRQGVPVAYYIPPGSWRREHQGSDLPRCTQQVLTPFAWSAEQLQSMGATARWMPHPLLRLARPSEPKETYCEHLGLDPYRPIVALLPGSRRHEVKALAPLYARVAESVYPVAPEVQFALSVASHLPVDWVHSLWADGSKQWVPTETRSVWNLLAHADVAIVCSGTATLEAALLNTPMLIAYRGDWLMNAEYKLRKRRLNLRWIGLPNLILQRDVCPEFIQDAAAPAALAHALLALLQDQTQQQAQREAFRDIRRALGENADLREGYEWIVELLSGSP